MHARFPVRSVVLPVRSAAIFSRQKARLPFQINAATGKFPATAAGDAQSYKSFKQTKPILCLVYKSFSRLKISLL